MNDAVARAEPLGSTLERAEEALHRDLSLCVQLLDSVADHPELPGESSLYARFQFLRGQVAYLQGDAAGLAAYQAARIGWLSGGHSLEARRAVLGQSAIFLMAGQMEDARLLVQRVLHRLEVESVEEELATRLHLVANRQLGAIALALGDHGDAMHFLDHAEELAHVLGDPLEAARVTYARGGGLILAGMVYRGLDMLCNARAAFQAAGAPVWADRVVVPIAEALTASGHAVAALDLLDTVAPALEGQRRTLGELELVRSGAMLSAGLGSDALTSAVRARDTLRGLGAKVSCANAEMAIARSALHLRRLDIARTALIAVESIAEEGWMPRLVERARLLSAGVALAANDSATAERIGRSVLASSPSSQAAIHAQLLVARTTGDAAEATALIASTSTKIDRLGQPELRLALRVERARNLRGQGDVAGAVAELRTAAEFAPQRLNRSLSWIDADATAAQAADELISMLLDEDTNSAVVEAWQRVRAVNRAAVALWRRQSDGWHVEDEPDGTASVDAIIAGARSHSRLRSGGAVAELVVTPLPDTPTVEFYLLGEDVVGFVLRDGLVHARKLRGAAAESARLVNAWKQECMLIAAAGPREGEDASVALDALFDLLIAPLAPWLTHLDDDEAVAVVGHRHLLAIPGEAMFERGAPWRLRLAGDAIGTPREAGQRGARPSSVLVLAVPDEAAPAIASEAEMIAARLPGAEVHLGAEATSWVLAKRSADADVVHIAAHGRVRPGNPLFSALLLGDGWCHAADLIDGRFDFTGRVVVLSSCVSGRGSERMLAPIGLVWACFAAGAAGVLASLWPVDDESTLELMGQFYAGLAEGRHPREALARAQRRLAEQRPHPYYWAAFQYFVPNS